MLDLTKVNWNKLYYYYLVGQYMNITEAARHANLDQSAMSRQIIGLEKELGTRLLIRKNSGVRFTEAGKSVYDAACEMYSCALKENEKLHVIQNTVSGSLKVLTTYSGVQKYAAHMPNFYEKFPEIRVQLNVISDLNSSNFLKNYDIAILSKFAENPEYEYIPIKKIKLGLFASKDYLKKNGTPQKPEDLDHHKLISFSSNVMPKGSFVDFHLNLGRKGKGLRESYFQVSTPNALLDVCQRGMGIISFVDEKEANLPENILKILDKYYSEFLDVHFIFKKTHKDVHKIQEFIKFFKEI